jgi:heat shock protein HslJ
VFEPWGIRGIVVCDPYWSEGAVVQDGVIEISEITSTNGSCPAEGTAARQRYLDTIPDVSSYHLDGDQLRLAAVDGRSLLFTRSRETAGSITPDFMGTEWLLVSINGEPLPLDASITLGFATDSEMDCNSYAVTFIMTGYDELDVQTGAMSTEGCYPQSMTLEQWSDLTDRYVVTLNDVVRYQVDGDHLRLETEDGRALVYQSASPSN